ncbi:MAG: nucleotide exchange factor GrpE, partial [Bacteroidales bacterium]|nr:nucleotide exchange factor GrpE [Bacteroidales bacterium]
MQAQGKKHQAQERPDVPHFDKDTRAAAPEVNGQTPVQETKEQQTPEQQTPELSRLQLQLDKTNDRLLRLQAEFDNYRKRTAKE